MAEEPRMVGPEDDDVQLGMPGAWSERRNETGSDHCTSKIGGEPDWPFSLSTQQCEGLLKCGVCGGYLGLVAQVHAPLEVQGMQLHERTIYIFGCPAPGCGVDPASWRTLRVQKMLTEDNVGNDLPRGPIDVPAPLQTEVGHDRSAGSINVHVPTQSESREGEGAEGPGGHMDVPTHSESREGGGAEGNSEWWDGNLFGAESLEGEAISRDGADAADMKELESLLMDASLSAASTSRKESRNSERKVLPRRKDKVLEHNLPVLPCFYINWQAESISRRSSSSPSSSEAAEWSDNVAGPVDDSGEAWAGEDYEPDQALHVDRTYLQFKKRLDRFPEQCLRYGFGGQVLWAVQEEMKEIGKCEACGGSRQYEMQLMPPLLYFLQQGRSKDSADEWDWSSLIVFTCAQSCTKKGQAKTEWSIVQEATLLQQEVTALGEKTDWSKIQEASVLD